MKWRICHKLNDPSVSNEVTSPAGLQERAEAGDLKAQELMSCGMLATFGRGTVKAGKTGKTWKNVFQHGESRRNSNYVGESWFIKESWDEELGTSSHVIVHAHDSDRLKVWMTTQKNAIRLNNASKCMLGPSEVLNGLKKKQHNKQQFKWAHLCL